MQQVLRDELYTEDEDMNEMTVQKLKRRTRPRLQTQLPRDPQEIARICKKIQEISFKISPALQVVNRAENGITGRVCTRLTRLESRTQRRESRAAASISEVSR